VQQMLAFYGWHQNGVGWYFALSFLCTLPPAILSYHAVEKQFMKWKHIRLPIFNGGQLKDASPMGNCTPSPAHVQNAV
jgi:peptidoglycan/LPS O-acetylase OafA/YrhL